ncbi:MAG: class I tRNA ligase family protein, partial [Clostridia bacterium]|nr:class I tRNA ligase family protein [Clostridia bacterium]
LFDKGVVPTKEPFKKLVHQGMILGSNGIKMGKRFPEYCINPLDVINEHGADTLRMYEMFMGPLEADKPWSDRGVEGTRKFLDRIYRIFESGKVIDGENKNLEKVYHQTVKKVTEDFEKLSFNTAISQMMIFINAVYKEDCLPKEYAEGFVKLLSPVCPFISEELWQMLGHDNTIAFEAWPKYDASKMIDTEVEIPVQVNGKLRGKVLVAKEATQAEVAEAAKANEDVLKFIEGKEIVKEIYVPGRMYTIVVK